MERIATPKISKKPAWLNKKVDLKACGALDRYFNSLKLNTVCREAACPNISECFSSGVATFLILGDTCTRDCAFCAVKKGAPGAVDQTEPARVSEAARHLALKHAVITSVTRDDLPDGGAALFSEVIENLRRMNQDIRIEVLAPDFNGNIDSVRRIAASKPDIFAHNIETVGRLYPLVRRMADYDRSLLVLKAAKRAGGPLFIKSGIMLGMGEEKGEVLRAFSDLKESGCEFLSIGQYLSPSRRHYPVRRYIPPEEFNEYKLEAMKMGFTSVLSGPYVRSSYMADRYLS